MAMLTPALVVPQGAEWVVAYSRRDIAEQHLCIVRMLFGDKASIYSLPAAFGMMRYALLAPTGSNTQAIRRALFQHVEVRLRKDHL